MEKQQLVRQTLADFLKMDPAALGPDFPLTGKRLEGSIGRTALDAALRRRAGLTNKAVYTARTYGELEAALLGTAPPATNGAPAKAVAPPLPIPADAGASLACGVDLEMVSNLPEAADYWEDDFYKSSFTPAEIAYCSMQQDPRMHFAARWCAKEALRKCDGSFLHEPLSALELASEDGRPFLRRVSGDTPQPLPHSVSVSHTPLAAVAVVIKPGPPPGQRPQPSPAPPAPATQPGPAQGTGLSRWSFLLSLLAAALAAAALLRTLGVGP